MIALPYPFEREYMQLALVASVAIGLTAPLVGAFLVQRRLSLLGDGVGHLAFAGVAAGLLTGLWPTGFALAVAVIGAVAIERLRSSGRASGDLALALFFYGGIAAGVVLLSLAGSLDASVLGYLFGQVLTVSGSEVAVIGALAAVVAVAVALGGPVLFAVTLDEEWAQVAGLPVGLMNSALAALAAAMIVGAMRVVGVLLVAALMALPVASAQLVAKSFKRTVLFSSLFGGTSAVVGLALARFWGLAAGATIVLVAVAIFVLTSLGSSIARRRSGELGPAAGWAITSRR
ncbi:MAG: metal ABC transporter permease [Acidimicrobiia bacterium]